jgi:8-oxo-dGTP pyrophosphatase MutT (NUDIX family)
VSKRSRSYQTIDQTRVEDLEAARALIAAYEPRDEAQAEFRERMLVFIAEHPLDAHKRSCLSGHLTASCLLLDHDEDRALLTHHAKLNRWLQLGGHVDGDANLPAGALREALEESGIPGIEIDPRPIDIDIHIIPERGNEPEHWHLDVRFIARAPQGAKEVISEESLELGWFTPTELDGLNTDPSVRRLFELALS